MDNGIADVWNTLPLITRKAICTHLAAARRSLEEIRITFAASTRKRIEASEPAKRYDTFQESLYRLLPLLDQVIENLARKEGEALVAWAGSISATDDQLRFVEHRIETDCITLMDEVAQWVPRLLKEACDGELLTAEDRDFITDKQLEWANFNPGKLSPAERKGLTFRSQCGRPDCREEVLKVASHRGGTEFDIPQRTDGANWQRHRHYSDTPLLLKMILERWKLPAWWVPGTTRGKEIASIRGLLGSTMSKVLKRESEQVTHRLAISVRPIERTPTAHPDSGHAQKQKRPNEHDRAWAKQKTANPEQYPEMEAAEVAAYLSISLSTAYTHPTLERINNGTGKVIFTTKSVLAAKRPMPE